MARVLHEEIPNSEVRTGSRKSMLVREKWRGGALCVQRRYVEKKKETLPSYLLRDCHEKDEFLILKYGNITAMR